MKGYKAFDKGLVCRGKQYAENTVFEEDEAVICQKGMHFCAEPMDVLSYYPPESEFAEVEAPDEAVTDDKRKYVTKKLKVGSKMSLKELISAQVKIDLEKAKEEGNDSYAQGYGGHAAAQGDEGHAAVGGKDAIAVACGVEGKAKACLGSWIMLAEWVLMGDGWHIKTVKTAKIDGEKLKADPWYMLKNGEFEEEQNED